MYQVQFSRRFLIRASGGSIAFAIDGTFNSERNP